MGLPDTGSALSGRHGDSTHSLHWLREGIVDVLVNAQSPTNFVRHDGIALVEAHAWLGQHLRDVGCEVPLVAFLAQVHLGVPRMFWVLDGAGRSNQRGIDHRASAQQQALGLQQCVGGRQDLGRQLVLFELVARTLGCAKAQDGALIR